MRYDFLDKHSTQLPLQEMLLPAATGTVLRRVRECKGLTQTAVADLSDMNLTYISNVENGMSNISIIKLYHLCNALSVTPEGVVARSCHVVSNLCLTEADRPAREIAFLIRQHSQEDLSVDSLVKAGIVHHHLPIIDLNNFESRAAS